jgi:hypothetical protein
MTERNRTVEYWVSCFLQRHYGRGKGPTAEEISKWMTNNIWGLDRPLMRRIEKAITKAAAERYSTDAPAPKKKNSLPGSTSGWKV